MSSYDELDRPMGMAAQNLARGERTPLQYPGGTSTTHAYNGDGVLVAQTRGSTSTRYAHDPVAPLSQVLQLTHGLQRTDDVYGHERLLRQQGVSQSWYGHDALGRVLQSLDGNGLPLTALSYDPWGLPQGDAPPAFGFTAELQDARAYRPPSERWDLRGRE